MSHPVFHNVRYHLSDTIPLDTRRELAELLDARGASSVALSHPSLTHFITPSLPLEDFVESLPDDSAAHSVTPRWVERSAILNALQPPQSYSPDPAYLFSGVTATATDLSQSDCELMSAAITALGGQWRSAYTRDVTHLFALAPGSPKYDTAMHFKSTTSVRLLVPHWFDDSVRLGIRDLPTENYEWPEPRVFQSCPEGRSPQEDIDYEPPPERTMLYQTASLSNDEQGALSAPKRNVWDGKRLLLGLSLDLSDGHRKALHADIRRQGGDVVELSLLKSSDSAERAREEIDRIDEADVFVTRFRTGAAYAKAYQLKKTIGTLAWLWYVRSSGTLTRPADQLLHYPTPSTPAPGFEKEVVTVTNYTGKDREYIKKLITLMGGEFTAAMAADTNTVVVAAYLHGTKTDKATSWSIPIVNHTWVEDCFVQWRRLTPARDKYIVFPPGVDFSTILAERGLGRIVWEPGQLEEMQRAVDEVGGAVSTAAAAAKGRQKSKSASTSPKKITKKTVVAQQSGEDEEEEGGEMPERPPAGTGQSAGEVEAAVAMDVDADTDGGGEDMDVDEEEAAGPKKAKKTTTKKGPPGRRVGREQPAAEEAPVAKRRLVRRYSTRRTDDEDEAEAEEAAAGEARPSTPSPKRPVKTYGSTKKKRRESVSPAKKAQDMRRKAQGVDIEVSSSSSVSEDEDPRATTKAKERPKQKLRATKEQPTRAKDAKTIDLAGTGSDEESTDEDVRSVLGDLVPNRKGKTRGAGVVGQSPQRLHSVLVPTVASVYRTPTKQNQTYKAETKAPGAKAAPQKKVAKTAVAADESEAPPRGSKTKKVARARSPSESSRATSPPPPAPPKGSRRKSALAENAEAGPSRASTSSSPSKLMLMRTPSKRSAATKATRALHDVIMPDLVSFQKELKKGAVRPAYEREHPEAVSGAVAKGKTPVKGRKRPSASEADDEEEEEAPEEEEMPEKKKRKHNNVVESRISAKDKGKRKIARKSVAESEEPESQEAAAPSRKKAAVINGKAVETKNVNMRVMTTQLSLADDVVKGLGKLGVKFVTKPAECTHLLVRSVVRTEKFLCAMAVAPYVLNEKWATMSSLNRKLLPESEYAIKDKETENKYGFSLADALKRARANAGKLFAGVTFYVTPKVPVEIKLLKNVVTANGGQVSTQTPTLRILSGHDNRVVISSVEDVSIWRPLAHQHKIYTQELILTSALRQDIDWDDAGFRVPGSS